ncbi:MAG TPA: potassium channel family protein [Acidobacteriota bacterium]|nr:potassium channel family protein [Acidobacteriota bacterium]HQF88065.1 potassium channel family protein [Acidobacteriota bacterium]HQG92125.1 potassium channel family protein [Acidobacteriota bacterium]HQK86359.1 potassium channel family protein [Acidobacteriota bacterium]
MKPIHQHLREFWWQDRSMVVLLVGLVVVIFIIYPMGGLGHTYAWLLQGCISVILIAGVVAVARTRVTAWLVAGVAVAGLASRWLVFLRPSPERVLTDAVLFALVLGVLAAVVLVQVFRAGPITAGRIVGAVVFYLLLGLMWANVYTIVVLVRSEAFRFPVAPRSANELVAQLIYFSFVTLTTTGYGDVLPLHPLARTLANLEALVGQLYPAILIARLVSLELMRRPADQ